MNFSEIYNTSIVPPVEEKENVVDREALSKAMWQQHHSNWMEHPMTKRFLAALNNESKQLVEGAAEMSVNHGVSSDAVRIEMQKYKQNQRIIKYALESIIGQESL